MHGHRPHSLIVIRCSLLYVHCRFGVHYELPLLLQSIIMIATMLAMMHICVTVRNETATTVVHRSLWGKKKWYTIIEH